MNTKRRQIDRIECERLLRFFVYFDFLFMKAGNWAASRLRLIFRIIKQESPFWAPKFT